MQPERKVLLLALGIAAAASVVGCAIGCLIVEVLR
jgi:hypothetical protein